MSNQFIGKVHNHALTIYRPKSNRDIDRVRTAFLEQAEKLNQAINLIGTMSPVEYGDVSLIMAGKVYGEIVGIGCCKACADNFIMNLEDALAITKDLRKMIEDAPKDELELISKEH